MRVIEEHLTNVITLDKMKLDEIGIVTTGFLAGHLVLRQHPNILSLNNFEEYRPDSSINVKIYPKGTILKLEV